MPSNFIAGRHKVALLFWFFGDFRCGDLLFLFDIKIENRQKKSCSVVVNR